MASQRMLRWRRIDHVLRVLAPARCMAARYSSSLG
jgi:ribosomal protein L15E